MIPLTYAHEHSIPAAAKHAAVENPSLKLLFAWRLLFVRMRSPPSTAGVERQRGDSGDIELLGI